MSSKFTTFFQLFVILCGLVYFATTGASIIREQLTVHKPIAGTELVSVSSHTTVESAQFTFTNTTEFKAWACVKGVVTSIATGTKVESMVICTGEMQPHSTQSILAPYRVGAVLELCHKLGYGDTKITDWSKCSFDMIDMTNKVKQLSV